MHDMNIVRPNLLRSDGEPESYATAGAMA